MYVKAVFEVFKILGKLGIKNKDIIGMGGNVVKMGKSLFNTRVNPKLLTFIEKNQKIPTKILEEIKLHARTLKNASENQKNLFLENLKSIQKAKTLKPPVSSVQRPGSSNLSIGERMSKIKGLSKQLDKAQKEYTEIYKPKVKELPEWTQGWKPTVIKGGKDKLATGGIANHFRTR
jgi:biotin synthase-related radical SAM superfamily protein